MAVGGSSPRIVPIALAPWGFLNAYLVQGERTIVVDAGYPRMARRILGALEREGTDPRDVSLILLTHGHLDHLGGVTRLRQELDAPVALHSADAAIARSGRDRALQGTDLFGRAFALFAPRTAPAFEPDIVHDGELDLAPFGVPGHTLHTPGHTPGSVSVVLDEAVLCGDLPGRTCVDGLGTPAAVLRRRPGGAGVQCGVAPVRLAGPLAPGSSRPSRPR